MPPAARIALVVAVVALAVVVTSTVTGLLPRVVATLGSALGGVTDIVFATPVPSQSLLPVPPAPSLAAPETAYTNQPTVTFTGTVPTEAVGRSGYAVRVYVALPDQEPVAVRDVSVGQTPTFVVEDLPLEVGRNDVSATLVGPGGESASSPAITFVLDTSKPKITVTAPEDGAIINGPTVTITGKTQTRATVVARNEATGAAATTTAVSGGAFTLEVPLRAGVNPISLTVTDPAGNVGTAVLSVRQGSGVLAVALGASAYRLSAAKLPRNIQLRAQVTDPDGNPMVGETVTFTLTIPGVTALTGEEVTDESGAAVFATTIPAGATEGSGLGTAFVSTADFGEASGRISITIIP